IMMSQFIKELMIQKIKSLSLDELQTYSRKYNFHLTEKEALNIISYLQNHHLEPFSADGRVEMFRELAQITNTQTAKRAQQLFLKLIKTYNVEHLFHE